MTENSRAPRLGLVGLLVELALPVTVCSALLLMLVHYTPYWDLHTRAGLAVFTVLLVLVCLILSARLDTFTREGRRSQPPRLNRANPRWRMAKLALGGIAIPVAALAAATHTRLRTHETPLDVALRLRLPNTQADRARRLGVTVLRAASPEARVQGIVALQSLGPDEGLPQLLRVLDADPAALVPGRESRVLSRALASFGSSADAALVERLEGTPAEKRRAATVEPEELYERYFASDFEDLASALKARPGAEEDLARLDQGRESLQRALGQIGQQARPDAAVSLPGFILSTFRRMEQKEDPALLSLARRTVADAGWSDAVRGQALLLLAKQGTKDDLERMYALLDDPSPLLQARNLEAIAVLQSRLSLAASKS